VLRCVEWLARARMTRLNKRLCVVCVGAHAWNVNVNLGVRATIGQGIVRTCVVPWVAIVGCDCVYGFRCAVKVLRLLEDTV